MKNLLLALMFALPLGLSAQYLEVGVMAGAAGYQGELTYPSVDFKELQVSYGAFARYNLNPYISFKLHAYGGWISGDDANAPLDKKWGPERQARNLSFKSRIIELGFVPEINILGYEPEGLYQMFSPYIFGGVAVYNYNPQAKINDEWYDLQPLNTEGQGLEGNPEPYKLTQISFPMGVGVKFAITDKWNIGAEFGTRRTMNDYLDDVSTVYEDRSVLANEFGPLSATLANRTGEYLGTEPVNIPGGLRGNPETKDWYFMGGITVSYNLFDNGLVGGRRNTRSGNGCYSF